MEFGALIFCHITSSFALTILTAATWERLLSSCYKLLAQSTYMIVFWVRTSGTLNISNRHMSGIYSLIKAVTLFHSYSCWILSSTRVEESKLFFYNKIFTGLTFTLTSQWGKPPFFCCVLFVDKCFTIFRMITIPAQS